MSSEYQTTPIDPQSAERLATAGLRMDLVDTSDAVAFESWLQAEARGFHGPRMSKQPLTDELTGTAYRRTTGVWDATAADSSSPVATVSSWASKLTVPGKADVDAWAISAVTVSPTHRRRGIARGMLEAELRTANSLGIPVAALTVSEATIYSRYGFAPAAMSVDLHFSTSRAQWTGPEASGRLHFISAEQLLTDGQEILDRVRLNTPGEITLDGFLWQRLTGLVSDSDDKSKSIRAVRYDDVAGVPQGFAIYKVIETGSSFSAHRIDVDYLVSATPDAASGLWRFLLEMDLVSEVHARLRPLTDPVVWQVADFRAVTRSDQRDHLWVRVLDVTAALEARAYSAPGEIVLDITDPLGFSNGRFLLSINDSGSATVTADTKTGAGSDAAAHVSLSINEIGALYLGGTSAATLVAAGRITELTPGAADVVDASFRTASAPLLSFWF